METKRFKSPDGTIRYVKNGKLHNLEKEALIHPNGEIEYYINGFKFTKDKWEKVRKDGEDYNIK